MDICNKCNNTGIWLCTSDLGSDPDGHIFEIQKCDYCKKHESDEMAFLVLEQWLYRPEKNEVRLSRNFK